VALPQIKLVSWNLTSLPRYLEKKNYSSKVTALVIVLSTVHTNTNSHTHILHIVTINLAPV